MRTLRDAGHVAYFAGGCVRDLLLGIEPKDYDVATDAEPARVRTLFRSTQSVGAAFGVILVRLGRSVVEVATFRTDLAYIDGRRPSGVRFTTPEEDAQRRDFTINGLFLDPVTNDVIDFVGGRGDLSAKVVRAIGNPDQRFAEDHLRLLRAVRFAARLGFTIEPATASAIGRHAAELPRISPERIADELRRMLTPPTRIGAWRMLWDLQLMPVLFRALPGKPVWPSPAEKSDSPLFPHVAPGETVSFGLALAAVVLCYRRSGGAVATRLLLEAAEVRRSVQACRTLLRISNDEAAVVEGVLSLGPLLRDEPPTVAQMKRFLAKPMSAEARLLLDAIRAAETGLARIAWLREQFAAVERTDVAPAPLITGDDLTAAGLRPGPAFRRVLDVVYDAQLEGRVATRDEAMAMAVREARGAAGHGH